MTLKYNLSKGFHANVGGWEKAVDYAYLSALSDAMPKIKLLSGGGEVSANGTASVTVSLTDALNEPISRSTTLFLEETGGYLPKRRIELVDGVGSFKVMATGLAAGEQFKVKVGFRTYSGVLDVPFEVV